MNLIKKDNYFLGFLIGVAFPMMIIGLIFILGIILGQSDILLVNKKLYLLGVIMNLLFMRLYFINWKMEKSGKGILISSFLYIVAFFVFIA